MISYCVTIGLSWAMINIFPWLYHYYSFSADGCDTLSQGQSIDAVIRNTAHIHTPTQIQYDMQPGAQPEWPCP